MAGPQTTRALNRRALSAASSLDYWTENLWDEMKKQNVKSYSSDSSTNETLTLKWRDARNLIHGMERCAADLRRFAEYPRRSVRRSPRGFTP
jgi:hypothetical protein